MLKNKKHFIFIIAICILLNGCSFRLKTKEIKADEYESIGNEIKLFNIGIGEQENIIVQKLGEPKEREAGFLQYPSKNLSVYIDGEKSYYFITSNPDFVVLEDIVIGSRKEEIINEQFDLDIFGTTNKNGNEFLFLTEGNQKLLLELNGDVVSNIILSSKDVPFDKLLNYTHSFDEDDVIQSDEEVKMGSKFLTFDIDLARNNKKALNVQFFEYAKIGVIEKVMVPLETFNSEVVRRFGEPNYVFEGKGQIEKYYFYKKLNVYLGINEEDQVIQIRLPVQLKTTEFQEKHNLASLEPIILGQYKVSFTEKDGIIEEILISL